MRAWDTVINRFRRYLNLPTTHKEYCERLLERSNNAIEIEEQYLTILRLWDSLDLSKITVPSKRNLISITVSTHSPNIVLFRRHLEIISELTHKEDRTEITRYIQYNLKSKKQQSLDNWLSDENGLPEDLQLHLKFIKETLTMQMSLFDNLNINNYGWMLPKMYDDLYAITVMTVDLLGD